MGQPGDSVPRKPTARSGAGGSRGRAPHAWGPTSHARPRAITWETRVRAEQGRVLSALPGALRVLAGLTHAAPRGLLLRVESRGRGGEPRGHWAWREACGPRGRGGSGPLGHARDVMASAASSWSFSAGSTGLGTAPYSVLAFLHAPKTRHGRRTQWPAKRIHPPRCCTNRPRAPGATPGPRQAPVGKHPLASTRWQAPVGKHAPRAGHLKVVKAQLYAVRNMVAGWFV